MRAIDSLYPAAPGFRQGVAGGITTANVMPGSGNVMGGQTAYIKLRGKTVAERAAALIEVAHPEFQDELRSEAKRLYAL